MLRESWTSCEGEKRGCQKIVKMLMKKQAIAFGSKERTDGEA